MARYITKRVLRSLITMFIIITILFALLRLMPVEGYFENYDKMSSTQIQVKLQALGVTAPLPTQLLRFYKQVLHGDLGESNVYRKGVAITEIIAEKIPISLETDFFVHCPGAGSPSWHPHGAKHPHPLQDRRPSGHGVHRAGAGYALGGISYSDSVCRFPDLYRQGYSGTSHAV